MDSTGGQELSEETKAERLMRLRLSAYIVNCLLVVGFDTLDVIAKIDDQNCNASGELLIPS